MIGSSLLVTLAGFTIVGTDSGDYFLTRPTITVNITARDTKKESI